MSVANAARGARDALLGASSNESDGGRYSDEDDDEDDARVVVVQYDAKFFISSCRIILCWRYSQRWYHRIYPIRVWLVVGVSRDIAADRVQFNDEVGGIVCVRLAGVGWDDSN